MPSSIIVFVVASVAVVNDTGGHVEVWPSTTALAAVAVAVAALALAAAVVVYDQGGHHQIEVWPIATAATVSVKQEMLFF